MIFHSTETNTYDEPTLMLTYREKVASLEPKGHTLNDTINASAVNDDGQTQFFPDISTWQIEEIERMFCKVKSRLASKWSVNNTFKFYRSIDRTTADKLRRGRKTYTGRKVQEGFEGVEEEVKDVEDEGYVCDLELGLGLNKLIEIANNVYGMNNWMTDVGDSQIIRYNEEVSEQVTKDEETGSECTANSIMATLSMSTKVNITLADNTTVTQRGFGYAHKMNREMAFKKCKKESVTDGMKRCFAHLVVLMLDYEEKVRQGYYQKYR
jgi:hypothetical protein